MTKKARRDGEGGVAAVQCALRGSRSLRDVQGSMRLWRCVKSRRDEIRVLSPLRYESGKAERPANSLAGVWHVII